MGISDSDSSGTDDFTETNVLLGYASRESSDDVISHLGGRPIWFDSSIPPSATLARCKVCNDIMVLLLQLNGNLPEVFPKHWRRLYVLICRRKTCRRKEGSVRALRAVTVLEASASDSGGKKGDVESKQMPFQLQTKPDVPGDIGEIIFGATPIPGTSSTNPFSDSTNASKPANPFSMYSSPFTSQNLQPLSELAAKPSQTPTNLCDLPKTFASALSLDSPAQIHGPRPLPEPWPPESELPPPYPLLYVVDADYETLDKINDGMAIPRRAIDLGDDKGSTSQKEDKETYESTIDKTFQKFADRLAQNPEQVIRYEFKGQPLLYSNSDAVGKLLSPSHSRVVVGSGSGSGGVTRCGNCGAGRTFEVQLTPHAITELEADETGLEGMDWGTIIVGVCERDCVPAGIATGEAGYLEEWAGVQWEEVGAERK